MIITLKNFLLILFLFLLLFFNIIGLLIINCLKFSFLFNFTKKNTDFFNKFFSIIIFLFF